MSYLLKYFIRRIRREGFKSLSVPVLALALVFLINVLGGIRLRMETEFQEAIDSFPIFIEASDGDGSMTDDLHIGERYLGQFTDPDALWSLYDFVDDISLKRELFIMAEETPTIFVEMYAVGWVDTISYIASDYNDGVVWHAHRYYNDAEVTSYAYPDPGVVVEALEGYSEDFREFAALIENEDGSWSTDPFRAPAVIISDDLLPYVENNIIFITLVQQRGPNVRLFGFHFEVCGIVSGTSGSMLFVNHSYMQNIWWTLGENPRTLGPYFLLPDGVITSHYGPLDVRIIPETPRIGSLAGVTSLAAHSSFSTDGAFASFYDGFDDSVFRSDENVALVSDEVLDWVGDDGILRIRVRSRYAAINDVDAEFRVVGTVGGVDEALVFAPFSVVSALGVESDNQPAHTELIRARLSDNRDIDDFKETAMRTFTGVGVFFNPRMFSMTIFDSEFYDITEALMQTIFFIDIATPFVYFITICVGFVASFLLTRRRGAEFAMMRSVGVNKVSIFLGTLFEQTFLCAVGVALGCVLFSFSWGFVFFEEAMVFLGCYVLGVVISAARAAGTDVLRLLRERE